MGGDRERVKPGGGKRTTKLNIKIILLTSFVGCSVVAFSCAIEDQQKRFYRWKITLLGIRNK